MSLVQEIRSSAERSTPTTSGRPWMRCLLLAALLLCSLVCTIVLRVVAPPADGPTSPFLQVWMLGFIPYVGATLLVLLTRTAGGRWQWGELGIILLGALLMRAILLLVPPDLSHDSWRYLWDARVTLHGYSPYVYAPGNTQLVFLRDFIYDNSRFRNVPTIYPPGAQAIFLLSYLLAPSNLFFFKGILITFEIVTCIALALLLKRNGQDPARIILYAWCPLPIVEFALQGHLDAITIMFTVLTLLCNTASWRGARVLTGFLLALATLTKIYPLVLLVVVLRRRDWALLTTCFVTIVLAYVPYLLLGHGQVFGFFATYASETTPNAGVVQLCVTWVGQQLGLAKIVTTLITYALDLALVGGTGLLVLVLRWRGRISVEMGALALIGSVFAASSHIFPWYTPVVLPLVAMILGPLWTRTHGLNVDACAALLAAYLSVMSILGYFFQRDWSLYYLIVYDVVLLGLLLLAGRKLNVFLQKRAILNVINNKNK
jgi:Glycosyltransferase family 87